MDEYKSLDLFSVVVAHHENGYTATIFLITLYIWKIIHSFY